MTASFVVDASLAAAWVLPDESSGGAANLLDRLPKETAAAPSLFRHEMRSLLVQAERRGRISAGDVDGAIGFFGALPVADHGAGDDRQIVALARRHALTAYDAAYLALALEESLPLATLDKRLAAAAVAENVVVIGPLAR